MNISPSVLKKYISICLLTTMFFLQNFALNECRLIRADTPKGEEIFEVKFENGQLSVKLKNSPLEKVLKEIMSQSGAKIWLNDSIDTTITIEFQNLPIEEGVRKIIKNKNYAFVFAPHGSKDGKLSIISSHKSKETTVKGKDALSKKPVQPAVKKDKPKKERRSFEELVKEALENPNADKREDAIIALGETKDKKAIEVISKALTNDSSEDVRLSCLDALLEIGDKSVVDVVSVALRDKEPWVRESAVEALGELGGEAAIELIKNALNDDDGSVRELAKEILEEQGKDKN